VKSSRNEKTSGTTFTVGTCRLIPLFVSDIVRF
jgi:hypothetical protein